MIIKGTIHSRIYKKNKFSKLPWWILVKIKNEEGKLVTVIGSVKVLPSIGDYIIGSGSMEGSKFGIQFKGRSLSVMEPQEKSAIISRISDFETDLTKNEISSAVTKYGSKIWKMIDEKKEIFPGKGLEEQLFQEFQPWKRSEDDDLEVIALMEFFEEKKLAIDNRIAKKIVGSLGGGKKSVVDRILEDVSVLAGLLDLEILTLLMKRLRTPNELFEETTLLGEKIQKMRDERHLCLPVEEFEESEEDEEVVSRLLKKKRLLEYDNHFYAIPPKNCRFLLDEEKDPEEEYTVAFLPKGNFDMELKTAQAIKGLLENSTVRFTQNPNQINTLIDEVTALHTLNEEQRSALKIFTEKRLSIVRGGPGNGKSRLITAIADLCDRLSLKYKLTAPTGMATKRIRVLSGKDACTLHSWLFGKEKEVVDVAIVDECSMVDSILLYQLFASGFFGSLIMLGDEFQLMPPGPGTPFKQLIASERIPITTLIKNYRFNEKSSGIEVALQKILKGNTKLENSGPGFTIIDTFDVENKLFRITKKNVGEGFSTDRMRILTPTNKSVKQNCLDLRELFNPGVSTDNDEEKEPYFPNDWIMFLRNDYDLNLFNGDIGKIISIDTVMVEKEIVVDGRAKTELIEELQMKVNFEGVEITLNSTKDITLTYCSTVHKAQGSESETVIFYLPFETRINTRELFYTATSRAKNEIIVIGSLQNIKDCIKRKEPDRHSCLKSMIIELLAGIETSKEIEVPPMFAIEA